MEIGGNMFGQCDVNRGQNVSTANSGYDVWELRASRLDWGTNYSNKLYTNTINSSSTTTTTTTHPITMRGSSTTCEEGGSGNEPFFFQHGDCLHQEQLQYQHEQQTSLNAGYGSQHHPDPHLMCLNLGKRHYFEDATPLGDGHMARSSSLGKRGKPYTSGRASGSAGSSSSSSFSATVPRCQVEGCQLPLLNAKDYHRRHKVCEMHSKAPRVLVLGLEQRFCQQCSRFHPVSEFDDSKRSCRRRLAGHNERRRKSAHDSANRIVSQGGAFPYLSSPTGCAFSLLSFKTDSWVSPADLSSRSSAALRELIEEHRAAILARQLISDRDRYTENHGMEDIGEAQRRSCSTLSHQHQTIPEPHGWNSYHENGTELTLDLMRASSSAFGLLSVRGKSKEEDEECSDLWNSFHGGM